MRRKFGDFLHKRHLASFNLAILLHFAVSTVVTKGLKRFKFGGFFSKSPIRQIKALANISRYMVIFVLWAPDGN